MHSPPSKNHLVVPTATITVHLGHGTCIGSICAPTHSFASPEVCHIKLTYYQDSQCDAFRDTLIEQRKDINTMSDDAHQVQKMLRDALAGMPVTIESGLSDPKASVTSKLKWVEIALRVFRGPVGRRHGSAGSFSSLLPTKAQLGRLVDCLDRQGSSA
jgi:hypothetical protein